LTRNNPSLPIGILAVTPLELQATLADAYLIDPLSRTTQLSEPRGRVTGPAEKGTMDDKPIIIKPPSIVRQNFRQNYLNNISKDKDKLIAPTKPKKRLISAFAKSHAPTKPKKSAMSANEPEKRVIPPAQGKKSLRNSHIRNPKGVRNPKEPHGVRSPINFKKSHDYGVDCPPGTEDDEPEPVEDEELYLSLPSAPSKPLLSEDDGFFGSMRMTGRLKSRREIKQPSKPEPVGVGIEYTKLRDMADDARETKNVLLNFKKKITSLEENLKEQDFAMREVLSDNQALEKKVESLTRKEKVESLTQRGTMIQLKLAGGQDAMDESVQNLVEENKALETEIERLKLNNLDQVIGDTAGQEIVEVCNKLLINEKKLEKELSSANEENVRLHEELIIMGDRSCIEGQALLEHNRMKRKETQLERSLTSAQKESKELLKELESRNLEFVKLEREREKQEEEIRILCSELEMNRRIVHTKRSLIKKEMTDSFKENMRNEMTEQLTIELTTKIKEELETLLKGEKERELRELREEDEEKVATVENQIPILEDEIDRLRIDLSNAQEDHERVTANIEADYQSKIEFMVANFSEDREREELDFVKRTDILSTENERAKERFEKEKEEYGSRLREEVTTEMQKQTQILVDKVAELTKESIVQVEKMTKEKELYGNNIREELSKERDELLEESAKEKESYAESIRQEMIEERKQEIGIVKDELEKIIIEKESLLEKIDKDNSHQKRVDELEAEIEKYVRRVEELERERNSLYQRVEEAEGDLHLTKENYENDVDELDALLGELLSSRNQIAKLKKQKQELVILADEFKNDCTNMSKEVKKIKGHFKFAVLVEYEEKIMELESELQRLEAVVEESKAFSSDDDKKMSEQSLQLEQYKAKEQARDAEVKRLMKELMSSVSDLDSKESRLAELKVVIRKKETEASKLNECVKDLRRSLGACENELARVRNDEEVSNQMQTSAQVYSEKITSLNKELAQHKSRLEHCRCDGDQPTNSGPQGNSEYLKERIQRLSVMLRVAEKNQHKEKLNFEETKERLDKNLLSCNNEIEGLYSEVSRLKNLLNRSQAERESWQLEVTQNAQTPRIRNNQRLQQQELLHKIGTAEKVVGDTKQHRSDSEKIIRNLKNELSVRDEEKRKLAQELRDSKALFREAVMAWRVETRSLKNHLKSVRTDLTDSEFWNHSDGDSEPKDDTSNRQERFLQILTEDGDSENRENKPSFQIREIGRDSWSRDNLSKSELRPESPTLQSISELDDSEIRDDMIEPNDHSALNGETEVRDVQVGEEAMSETFSKMLDISEHTTSIEMKIDHPNDEQSEADKASQIYNSLQEFKKEYKQYLGINVFTDMITKSIGNPCTGETAMRDALSDNEALEKKAESGIHNKPTKLAIAPQPHLKNNNDKEDQSMCDLDSRDDNMMGVHGKQHVLIRDTSLSKLRDYSLSEQNSISTIESSSERSNVSGRSRDIRKKMSELLEIKNNIKNRSSPSITAGNMKQKQEEKEEIATATTTTTAKTSKAPFGLVPGKNPKLYKFLKSKSSSEKNHRGSGIIPMSPTDEHLDRKNVLPFDETSKHRWRE
jgi:hypothetical protein